MSESVVKMVKREFFLTPAMLTALDRQARKLASREKRPPSRSRIVRLALSEYLKKMKEEEITMRSKKQGG